MTNTDASSKLTASSRDGSTFDGNGATRTIIATSDTSSKLTTHSIDSSIFYFDVATGFPSTTANARAIICALSIQYAFAFDGKRCAITANHDGWSLRILGCQRVLCSIGQYNSGRTFALYAGHVADYAHSLESHRSASCNCHATGVGSPCYYVTVLCLIISVICKF